MYVYIYISFYPPSRRVASRSQSPPSVDADLADLALELSLASHACGGPLASPQAGGGRLASFPPARRASHPRPRRAPGMPETPTPEGRPPGFRTRRLA